MFSRILAVAAFFGIVLLYLFHYASIGGAIELFGDESLTLFVVNQPPWDRGFYQSAYSLLAGIPGSFIEFYLYFRALFLIFSENFIQTHLELLCRLPLQIYILLVAGSFFGITWRLTGSFLLSGIFGLLLGTANPLIAHLASELRFHTPGFAYSSVSWVAWIWMVTGNAKRSRWIWIVLGICAPWVHLYSLYSIVVQTGFLLAMQFFLRKITWDKKQLFFTVSLPTVSVISSLIAFRAYSQIPGNRGQQNTFPFEKLPVLIDPLDKIFYPSFYLWMAVLAALILFSFRHWKTLPAQQKRERGLLWLFCLTQLGCILFLGTRLLKTQWGPLNWYPRYMSAAVPSLVVGLAWMASWFSWRWERPWIKALPVLWIAIFYFFPPRSYFDETDLQITRVQRLRNELVSLNLIGKATHAMGVEPNGDHSLISLESGGWSGHTWQVYGKGAQHVAPMAAYWKNQYGGLDSIPCSQKNHYALATATTRVAILDFCDKNTYYLRDLEQYHE